MVGKALKWKDTKLHSSYRAYLKLNHAEIYADLVEAEEQRDGLHLELEK